VFAKFKQQKKAFFEAKSRSEKKSLAFFLEESSKKSKEK
jgi:hypothetical protein